MPSKRVKTTSAPSVRGGGGTTVIDAFTDNFSIEIVGAETNATPDDDATFEIELDLDESSPDSFVETVTLELPASNWPESNAVPSDGSSVTLRVWLSGSAGTGVSNPGNANSENNGTVATLQTSLAGTNPIVMTSALGVNAPSGLTLSSVIYRGWFSSSNELITSNGSLVMESIGGLFSDITMYSNSGLLSSDNFLGGTFTFDLLAAGVDTTAKLQSCRMVHRVVDAVAGVTPHTMQVDAGCLEIAGAF